MCSIYLYIFQTCCSEVQNQNLFIQVAYLSQDQNLVIPATQKAAIWLAMVESDEKNNHDLIEPVLERTRGLKRTRNVNNWKKTVQKCLKYMNDNKVCKLNYAHHKDKTRSFQMENQKLPAHFMYIIYEIHNYVGCNLYNYTYIIKLVKL